MFQNIKFSDNTIVGIIIITIGLYLSIPTVIIFEKHLECIEAITPKTTVDYIKITSSKGGKSIKAELNIRPENNKLLFTIFENIGKFKHHPKFEDLKRDIFHYRKVNICYNHSQIKQDRTQIYKITTNNNKVLYSIAEAKDRYWSVLTISIVIGLFVMFILPHKRDSFRNG